MNLRASWIGRRAADGLRPGTTGWVLASFPRVCDLLTDERALIALAWNGVEKGPLTVSLDPDPASDQWVPPGLGAAFQVRTGEIWLFCSGSLPIRVDLSGAVLWEPRLHWEVLQCRRERITGSARIVARVVSASRRSASGLQWESRLCQATEAILTAQRRGDLNELRASVHNLCGLGEGLTPQGDDWLAGWLLGMRLAEPADQIGSAPDPLGALVLDVAAGRTTLLSRAFLTCAAAGEAAESWHVLLSQMAQDPANERILIEATHTILAHGATSGAAMLEGFLAGLGLDRGAQILHN